MINKIIPVILCGGAGTRMWPASREDMPKQFLSLFGDKSLFQMTLERLDNKLFSKPMVVANEDFRYLIEEQLLSEAEVILEPVRRNSAPAIAVAALSAHDDDILLVLPSDHMILNKEAFYKAVEKAAKAATDGHIVTFGIEPSSPHTGYGYIEKASMLKEEVYKLAQFHEKPNAKKALSLIENGCVWNSGMFIFTKKTMISELEKHDAALILNAKSAIDNGKRDGHILSLHKASFEKCTSISIDYAVMEKTGNAAVIPVSFGWSDVGNWASVWEASDKDAQANAVSEGTVLQGSKGCYVRSDRLQVNLVGCEDLVVIAEKDSVMITPKNKCEDVKLLVGQLKSDPKLKVSQRAKRPWGWYESLDRGESHQVKHICVKPGGKLSLQSHKHRAEHWTVVSGVAIVTRDHEEITVKPNESVYLPLGCIHRMFNKGDVDMHLIEVQCGDYFGEDDIVRYEDMYKRV